MGAAAGAGGGNIFQQSAGAMGQAQRTLGGLAQFQPAAMQAATVGPAATMTPAQLAAAERMQGVSAVQAAQAPDQIAVNQLATTDMQQYMSPYTQQVIEAGQSDIERQRQMASENLAAQAQRAGAFGGSRQAVQEGVLAGEAARQAAQLSAQQRQAGFQQAQQAAQYDIGQTQAARTLASQQGFQAEQLGQQAREAAAAREQAARAGNMQAANQFAIQQAQFEQQAGQANMQAENAMRQLQAQLTQQANQANFGGQFQGAGVRQSAAGGLAGLGQQGFNIGSQIQQQQAQQGLLQQGLQQALIDAARGQYAGFTGAPAASLSAPLAALGATPGQSTTTQTQSPGLFNYLQTLAMMPSFCWVAREVYGKDDPRWLEFRDWVVGFSPDWFFNAYGKYGERVAKIVKKVPILKSIIRPFMDAKRKAIGYK